MTRPRPASNVVRIAPYLAKRERYVPSLEEWMAWVAEMTAEQRKAALALGARIIAERKSRPLAAVIPLRTAKR